VQYTITMPLPPQIKTIVFDAYGTLLNVRAIEEGLQTHFGDQAEAISAVWRSKQLEYTWLRTLMGKYLPFSEVTREALHFACEAQGVNLSQHMERDFIDRYFRLSAFPEVRETLKQLSEKYQLAILSNADMAMLEGAVEYNQLSTYLTAVLSADTVGVFKPKPEVYEIAVRHFGQKREEIAFVSSNTWDVAGASAFGFFSIRLKRTNSPMDNMGFHPSMEIENLGLLI
jgi:2-haloacid dehalogenase